MADFNSAHIQSPYDRRTLIHSRQLMHAKIRQHRVMWCSYLWYRRILLPGRQPDRLGTAAAWWGSVQEWEHDSTSFQYTDCPSDPWRRCCNPGSSHASDTVRCSSDHTEPSASEWSSVQRKMLQSSRADKTPSNCSLKAKTRMLLRWIRGLSAKCMMERWQTERRIRPREWNSTRL